MNCSTSRTEPSDAPEPTPATSLENAVQSEAFAGLNRIVAKIPTVHGDAEAIDLLQEAVEALGCTAAVFASFIRDDATMRSCRYLFSRGPGLRQLYGTVTSTADDPWLHYAGQHFEPRRSRELDVPVDARAQRSFLAQAAEIGFRDAIIFPSHSVNGPSRVGMLCLGSDQAEYFTRPDALALLSVPASAMSFHLHVWWHARLRSDLINRVRLTPLELDLARMQMQGLTTKHMARLLGTPINTIDSRFARLCRRLGVGSRRAAVELLHSYGVI